MTFVQFDVDQTNIDKEVERLKGVVTQLKKDIVNLETVQLPAAQSKEATNQRYYYKQNSTISTYETERTNMVGGPIQNSPVTESDLTNLTGGRLWPPNAIELVRIPEFDGIGASTTNANHEKSKLLGYAPYQYPLVSGLTTVTAISATATSIITPTSTSISTNSNIMGLAGKQFIAHAATAGQSFIGLCSTAEDNSLVLQTTGPLVIGRTYTIVSRIAPDDFTGDGAPNNTNGTIFVATGTTPTWASGSTLSYVQVATAWTINFSFVTSITSNIPVGGVINGTWLGFTDTERIAQISSVPFAGARQTVMDVLKSNLTAYISTQLVFQNAEKVALEANDDPLLNPAALTNLNAAITYYSGYVLSPIISDAGFTTLNSTNSARVTQINSRQTEIVSALTPLYNKRYFWAVQRSGSGGSLVQILRITMAITAAKTDLADAEHKLYTMGEHGINVV